MNAVGCLRLLRAETDMCALYRKRGIKRCGGNGDNADTKITSIIYSITDEILPIYIATKGPVTPPPRNEKRETRNEKSDGAVTPPPRNEKRETAA